MIGLIGYLSYCCCIASVHAHHECQRRFIQPGHQSRSFECSDHIFASSRHAIRITNFDNLFGLTVEAGLNRDICLPAFLYREDPQNHRLKLVAGMGMDEATHNILRLAKLKKPIRLMAGKSVHDQQNQTVIVHLSAPLPHCWKQLRCAHSINSPVLTNPVSLRFNITLSLV